MKDGEESPQKWGSFTHGLRYLTELGGTDMSYRRFICNEANDNVMAITL